MRLVTTISLCSYRCQYCKPAFINGLVNTYFTILLQFVNYPGKASLGSLFREAEDWIFDQYPGAERSYEEEVL